MTSPLKKGYTRPLDLIKKYRGNVCTPENPMGSCMVPSEGACVAHYTYGRHKDVERDVLSEVASHGQE